MKKALLFLVSFFCAVGPLWAVEYTGRDAPDPFLIAGINSSSGQPVAVKAGSTEKLALKGWVWNTGSPQAIINSRIVKVGDTIEDAKIIAITKDGVAVNRNGAEFILKTGKGEKK